MLNQPHQKLSAHIKALSFMPVVQATISNYTIMDQFQKIFISDLPKNDCLPYIVMMCVTL